MHRARIGQLSLRWAPRCLARTRSGTPCQKPAAKGKKRCRLHGGAEGSGAPRGERNGAYRHGLYTREAIAERKAMRALIRSFREDARAALSELGARAPDRREEVPEAHGSSLPGVYGMREASPGLPASLWLARDFAET